MIRSRLLRFSLRSGMMLNLSKGGSTSQEESQEERQMNLKGEADEPERKLMVAMMLVRVKIRFIVEYKGKTPSAVTNVNFSKGILGTCKHYFLLLLFRLSQARQGTPHEDLRELFCGIARGYFEKAG